MANAKEAAKEPLAPAIPQPPAGFVEGGTPDIDGWFKAEVGTVVQGKILSHLVVPAKGNKAARDVIIVELAQPCIAYQAGDKTGKVLEAGKLLGVTVGYDLREALDYVAKKGEIWFTAVEKKETSGGNAVWKYRQFYKGTKVPFRGVNHAPVGADNDDIPF